MRTQYGERKSQRENFKAEYEEKGGKRRAYRNLWLSHVDIWQKPTQCSKAIILQLKIIKLKIYH